MWLSKLTSAEEPLHVTKKHTASMLQSVSQDRRISFLICFNGEEVIKQAV